MTSRAVVMRRLRESALWLGAVLGVLCLLLSALAWLFDVRPLVFRSGSMSPEIGAGALALAHGVPTEDVVVGDIVSVVNGEGVRVTHRVVSIDTTSEQVVLQLKGDANATRDQETYSVDDVYRVFVDVPWAGHIVNAASTPWGLLVCGGFVTLLLVSAFGGRRDEDDEPRPPSSRKYGRHTTQAVVGAATVGLLVAGGSGAAPINTMATFADTSVVTSGHATALTVPIPGGPSCASSGVLTPGVDITWNHMHAGASYVFEVRRRGNNALVSQTPIPATGAVGSRQKIVVNPNTYGIGGNTKYNGYLRTKIGTWESGSTAAIGFHTVLTNLFVYCS